MAGPRGFARGHAQRTYVCNTPILNSRVAGAWLAASMPMSPSPAKCAGFGDETLIHSVPVMVQV